VPWGSEVRLSSLEAEVRVVSSTIA